MGSGRRQGDHLGWQRRVYRAKRARHNRRVGLRRRPNNHSLRYEVNGHEVSAHRTTVRPRPGGQILCWKTGRLSLVHELSSACTGQEGNRSQSTGHNARHCCRGPAAISRNGPAPHCGQTSNEDGESASDRRSLLLFMGASHSVVAEGRALDWASINRRMCSSCWPALGPPRKPKCRTRIKPGGKTC